MYDFHDWPSSSSMRCSSAFVPSVVTTSACVSPRVNRQEPCVRGSVPTSIVIGRIWSGLRPSARTPSSRIIARNWSRSTSCRSLPIQAALSAYFSASAPTASAVMMSISSWRRSLPGIRMAARRRSV